jgi:hypothetical protein
MARAQAVSRGRESAVRRLKRDVDRRYPRPTRSETPEVPPAKPEPEDELGLDAFERRLTHLPSEIGVLLIIVGVAGLLLPGPVGSPFVIAGGLALWPQGFGRVEDWFRHRFPNIHRAGVVQIERYLADLEQRYPGSVTDAKPR